MAAATAASALGFVTRFRGSLDRSAPTPLLLGDVDFFGRAGFLDRGIVMMFG